MNCSSPQPSCAKVVGHVPQRPQQCHIQGEFHRAVPVLPVMLQEPGESDLLSKLEEHKLQQKVGCDLGQRPRPPTGRGCQGSRAVDGERDQRRRDGNGEQRNQVPAHRDTPAHTTTSEVRDTSPPRQRRRDQECSYPETQRPAHYSVQRLVERRDLGVRNRRDRRRHKANPEADQHEWKHRMACDATTHRRPRVHDTTISCGRKISTISLPPAARDDALALSRGVCAAGPQQHRQPFRRPRPENRISFLAACGPVSLNGSPAEVGTRLPWGPNR
jgi:hypothetical protein